MKLREQKKKIVKLGQLLVCMLNKHEKIIQ